MNCRNFEEVGLGREEDYAQYRNEGVPWWMAIISLGIILVVPLLLVKGAIELFQMIKMIKEVVGWGGVFLPLFFIALAAFLDRLRLARQHIRFAQAMRLA